jgi:hypothetical protein
MLRAREVVIRLALEYDKGLSNCILEMRAHLTFMGPCIANVFPGITNKIQCYTIYLFLWNALHVSSGSSAHHQEIKTVYTASGTLPNLYCYLPMSSPTPPRQWQVAVKVWQSTRCCKSLWSKSRVNTASGCDPTERQGSSVWEAACRTLVTVCENFNLLGAVSRLWAAVERCVLKYDVNHGSRTTH